MATSRLYTFAHLLNAFIGKAAQLEELAVQPLCWTDLDAVKPYVETLQSGASSALTFPGMRRFVYSTCERITNQQHNGDMLPWVLLKMMPGLTDFDMAHYHFVNGSPGPAGVDTPGAEELRNLRQVCPKIERYQLDFAVDGRWPFDLLNELARFPQPIELDLYLHLALEDAKRLSKKRKCQYAFEYMKSIRKSVSLPVQSPFRVGFKTIRPAAEMEGHYRIPDYNFYLSKRGNTCCGERKSKPSKPFSPKFDFGDISVEELVKMSNRPICKMLVALPLGFVPAKWYVHEFRKSYTIIDEILRRCSRIARWRCLEDATLFDLWDAKGSDAHGSSEGEEVQEDPRPQALGDS